MSILTHYLSPREFGRVSAAFAALGYQPPCPDVGGGAYIANIPAQYSADLSEREVLAVVRFGLSGTPAQGWTVREIVRATA